MKILLLGGGGFIGAHLTAALGGRGDQVQSASIRDAPRAARIAAQSDVVVNLAGESIAQRWSDSVKERITESRTDAPKRFLDALALLARSTVAYVSASAIGYYGMSETQTFTEESPPGDDFLARVCVNWEAHAMLARELGMRVAIVRSGIALGTDGGALAKMLAPFRLGVGGIIGSGCQWLSWIHIDDLVGIYLAAIDSLDGPVNATAPLPVTNAEFTKALSSQVHRPAMFRVPTPALRVLLGEGADMLLRGQRVLPKRLQELGYDFKYRELAAALEHLLPR
jgi:uncharacterized protein